MWLAFSILLALWALSIHFYLPIIVTFGLFAGMIFCAASALTFQHPQCRRLKVEEL
jgi:hypothetical protein